MIENLTYNEILEISRQLKENVSIINSLLNDNSDSELKDFVSTVEGYSKYLETTVELHMDADKALKKLAETK